MVYKIISLAYFLYAFVYTLSFAFYEIKHKKYLSFFGVLLLLILSVLAVAVII